MEDQTPSPAPITIPVLLARQLSDWQQLLTGLQAHHAPAQQLDYCQAQIERLQDELDSQQAD